jgi:hypothetical protein
MPAGAFEVDPRFEQDRPGMKSRTISSIDVKLSLSGLPSSMAIKSPPAASHAAPYGFRGPAPPKL